MNTEEQREILEFVLDAIEKMSLCIMTDDYDFSEMDSIYSEAQIYLGGLIYERMRLEQDTKE